MKLKGVAMKDNKIITFQGKTIRRTLFNDESYFVVIDVVAALTDSVNLQIIQSMHHKKNKQDK